MSVKLVLSRKLSMVTAYSTFVGSLYKHTKDCLEYVDPTKQLPVTSAPLSPLPVGIEDSQLLRQHLRILFVDDENPAAAGYLESRGFNVSSVTDVNHESIEKLLSLEYHIVFLDIYGVGKEFGGDGVGILKKLKSAGPLPYVAVYSAQQWSPGDPTYEDMFRLSDERADKQRPETFEGIVDKLGRRAFSIEGLAAEAASATNGLFEDWKKQLSILPSDEALRRLADALMGRKPERKKVVMAMANMINCIGGK